MLKTFEKIDMDGSYILGIEDEKIGTVEININVPKRRNLKTEVETKEMNSREMDLMEPVLKDKFKEIVKEIKRMRKC